MSADDKRSEGEPHGRGVSRAATLHSQAWLRYLYDPVLHARAKLTSRAIEHELQGRTGQRMTDGDKRLATLAACIALVVAEQPVQPVSTTPDDPEDRMGADPPASRRRNGRRAMTDASPVQGSSRDTGEADPRGENRWCGSVLDHPAHSWKPNPKGYNQVWCRGRVSPPASPAPSSADRDAATERVRAYLTARTEWAALTRLPENDEIGARFGDDATPVVVLLASDLRALLDGSERLGRAIREALAALESSKGHDSTMNARSQQAMGILHAALDASIAEQEGP